MLTIININSISYIRPFFPEFLIFVEKQSTLAKLFCNSKIQIFFLKTQESLLLRKKEYLMKVYLVTYSFKSLNSEGNIEILFIIFEITLI